VTHERRDRCIDQSVAFELRTSSEHFRNHGDPEVAAFTRPGVTGVFGAVVDDIERYRRQLTFQRHTQLLTHRGHVEASRELAEASARSAWRASQNT